MERQGKGLLRPLAVSPPPPPRIPVCHRYNLIGALPVVPKPRHCLPPAAEPIKQANHGAAACRVLCSPLNGGTEHRASTPRNHCTIGIRFFVLQTAFEAAKGRDLFLSLFCFRFIEVFMLGVLV